MYFALVAQMKKDLAQLLTWLDRAEAYAKEKGFDTGVLLTARLAPDQFPFVRQVQVTCDTAKLVASRLSGKEAPPHADTEQSFDALRERVRSVIHYLEGFSAKDFEGAATRIVTQPRWEGKVMTGADYLVEHGLPNFFFHLTHVYALLRHNGVGLGKRDYLGTLSLRTP